jgi:hypothetical protein
MPPRGCISQRKRLLELGDIKLEWCDGVPVQRVCVGGEELLNRGKYLAQLVEQLTQVIASLGLGGVRPEEEGQVLALLRDIAMQHEIGKQGLQAHTVEACHPSINVNHAEIAEQADVKGGLHDDLLASCRRIEIRLSLSHG